MIYGNYIKTILIYFLTIFTFMLIHELAHGITAIIFGGELKGIWLTSYLGFGKRSNDVSAFTFYTYTSYNDSILCYRCVKIAGSLTAILSALIVNYYSKKEKNITFFLASSNVIYYELSYWALSPLLKYGDAYQLLQSFNIEHSNLIFLFSLTFLVILISISVYFSKTLIKLLQFSY